MKTKMKFDHTDVFDLHPHHQLASRLMCLPTEIRLNILRLLLVAQDGQLPTVGNGQRVPPGHPIPTHSLPGTDSICLSSQVLRVCQSLYNEAIDMLYQENYPTIDSDYHPSSFIWDFRHFANDMSESLVNDSSWYKASPQIAESYKVLPRFSRIHIICRESPVYIHASRILRPYTTNKHVTVQLGDWYHQFSARCSEALYNHRGSPSCFAIWKCKSIKFHPTCTHTDCSARLKELESLITCTEHIHDLTPALVAVLKTISGIGGVVPGLGHDMALDGGILCRLRAGFEENNVRAFEEAARQFLQRAKEYLTQRHAEYLVWHDEQIAAQAELKLKEDQQGTASSVDEGLERRRHRLQQDIATLAAGLERVTSLLQNLDATAFCPTCG